MKLEFIENSGPDNLRDTLRAVLRTNSQVSIAVAFVTQAGLEGIVQPLREAAVRGRVRLITGLYQKVTQPEALEALLRIQEQTKGRLEVRLSRDPLFHRKLYLARRGTTATAIIGSSNLTREGLRSGGELNAMLVLPVSSRPITRLVRAFDEAWKLHSVALTRERIGRYRKVRPAAPKSQNYTKGELADILGAELSRRTASAEEPTRRYWRDCIVGFVKARTAQIVSETTNWDDANYDWYTPGGRHPFRIGDRILLFNFADKRVQQVEVKDVARTKVRTPDGRHFVAFRQVGRLRRRFSKSLWSHFKAEGIGKSVTKARRKLSLTNADRLRDVLKAH